MFGSSSADKDRLINAFQEKDHFSDGKGSQDFSVEIRRVVRILEGSLSY